MINLNLNLYFFHNRYRWYKYMVHVYCICTNSTYSLSAILLFIQYSETDGIIMLEFLIDNMSLNRTVSQTKEHKMKRKDGWDKKNNNPHSAPAANTAAVLYSFFSLYSFLSGYNIV